MDKPNNIIICVGRQLGSGGQIIARKLAEEFGCKLYDREILNLAAKESGFSEKIFEQNDEHKGFFRALLSGHGRSFAINNFYQKEFSEENLFQFQADAISKAASEGPCVFVGRCADYVPPAPHSPSIPAKAATKACSASAHGKSCSLPPKSRMSSASTAKASVPPTIITTRERSGEMLRATTFA